MNIKEFTKKTGLSAHTLRYYEKIGLMSNIKRDARGYRFYQQRDVIWVDFIQKLKITGMSLNDIRKYFTLIQQGDKTISTRKKLLENHCLKVKNELEKLQKSFKQIKCKVKTYRKLEKLL
jgi:DNA-binding transcriptional MerR regulator